MTKIKENINRGGCRLHFVRRHQENFFLEYLWNGRRFAPASRGYENKTGTHRALRALVFLIMLLRYESKLSTSQHN